MNNMNEKKYTHVQAAKLSGALMNEIYSEIRYTIIDRGKQSEISLLKKITSEQNLALNSISSGIDYRFSEDWWESLLRTNKCEQAKDIQILLLSADDALDVLYDLIEFAWAWAYEFSFILIIIRKIKEKDSMFKCAINIWNKLTRLIVENPEYECFNDYPYFDEIDFFLLPPYAKIEVLSPEKKRKIDEGIKLQLKRINENET